VDVLKEIDNQILRASSMLRDGDKPPYFLKGSNTFFGGQPTPIEIVLNVPADGDFYGKSLQLCLDAREVDTTVKTRPAFLPADWTYVNNAGLDIATYALGDDDIGSVSGLFELLLPEHYGSSPIHASAAFSARMGYAPQSGRAPFSPYAGALVFKTLEFIPRASAITVRFTPTYAKANTTAPEGQYTNEYRVTAVMSGYKKVKALR